MASDFSKDLFAKDEEATRITLGFSEDVLSYTPVVDEEAVLGLAAEFGVPHDRILSALRRWWYEMVQDQLNTFQQRLGELSYDADAATHFAQRFL
jgi:hypothetical protein